MIIIFIIILLFIFYKKNINLNKLNKEVNKLNTYQKTIIVNNTLIVINKSGIFEFFSINKKGLLAGDIKYKIWKLNKKPITNPYKIIKNAKYYFIINSKINFNVKGVWLITYNKILNMLKKQLENNILDENKIDKIYNELSNNVKK